MPGHAEGDLLFSGRFPHAVAGVFDGLFEIGQGDFAGEVFDGGLLGGQVDKGGNDAADLLERFLDVGDAGGAGHAADIEGDLLHIDAIAGIGDGFDQFGRLDLARLELHRGLFAGQVDAGLFHAVGARQRLFDGHRAGGAGQAGDRQRYFFRRFAFVWHHIPL